MALTPLKFSALPAAAALTGAETTGLVQSGGNVKDTLTNIAAFVMSQTFPVGSVGTPGLKIGEADVGFYQTAGKLHISLDGVETWRMISTGIAFGEGFDPTDSLHVRETGATAVGVLAEGEAGVNNAVHRFSANATGARFIVRKSRGTIAASTFPVTNDQAGLIVAQIMGGPGDIVSVGQFIWTVTAPTPSLTDSQGRLALTLTPVAATLPVEMMRWDYDLGVSMYGANVVIDQNRLFRLRSYTVATLPTPGTAGRMAYASNLRVFNGAGVQEGAGLGTGGSVVDNGTAWKISGTNVTAVA